jgi:hypothetical protein
VIHATTAEACLWLSGGVCRCGKGWVRYPSVRQPGRELVDRLAKVDEVARMLVARPVLSETGSTSGWYALCRARRGRRTRQSVCGSVTCSSV